MKKLRKVKKVKDGKKKRKSEQLRTEINKKRLISALESSFGLVATACQQVGIARKTYYEYLKTDEEFKEDVECIQERLLDFSEAQLSRLIRVGEPSAVYFHLKCRGKKRGYVEKSQIEDVTNEKKQKTIIGGREIEFE